MTALKKLNDVITKHPLKLEELEIPLVIANQYVEVMQDFLEQLDFSKDRIEAFECRRRDGYFPYSHNKGGLEGITYRDQYSACQNTGFENTDQVLAKYSDYAYNEWFKENNLNRDEISYQDLTSEQQDSLADFECEYSQEDTIQFQARIMMTSETTANVDFYVSASDSPYHRKSDDKLELEIEFKSPAGMKRKLAAILKHDFVKCLLKNIREGY